MTLTEETKHKCNVKWIASNDGCPSVLLPVGSLQVEGEEGEEGGPDGGADGGGGREGRAGGGRSRGVGRKGAGGRGGHDEDGAGDLSHLHCWWREREAYSDLVAAAAEKGEKKKKGKHTGSAKAGASEDNLESQENLPSKFKKNQRKNKNAGSLDAFDAKSISKKSSGKSKDDSLDVPSEDWIKQKILLLAPELEELGGPEDPHALLGLVSSHLRPMLVNSWMKRRDTVVLENAEKRRKLLDNLQRQLDEVFLDLQLYEKALDLFEDDPPLSVILHKHLLRTMATPLVDKILTTLDMENKLKNGIEIKDSENVESTSFTFVDRVSLAKGLPNSLSVKAQAVAEALEGKRLDTFMNALRDVVEESGLLVKKLDKKLERTMLHSHRKDLTSQVSSESDPVKLLPKVVALLYMQVYNKALQAPGRAISALISQLKDKLPDSTYKTLMDYHSATVTLLALQAAAVGDEYGCSADRILSQQELLESKMPELKALVLGTTNPTS